MSLPGNWRYVTAADTARAHGYYWSKCGSCGDVQPCQCRYCDCCSEYWTGDNTQEDSDDDGVRPRQDCPDCVAWKAAGRPE